MKVIYECEYCHQQFDSEITCVVHEGSHMDGIERLKYYMIYGLKHNPCDHCDHAYYVYGCERECNFKNCNHANNYKDFTIKGE